MIMNDKSIDNNKENNNKEGEMKQEGCENPFFKKYDTPHETAPFDKIRLEDYEEAFMEGIRRDNEQLDKIINNPEKPTFDNTLLNKDDDEDYYGLLGRLSTFFFNLLSAETNDESTTKAVMVLMLPPIFAVTTGAAVAAGPMIQVSRLSNNSFCHRLPSTHMMSQTFSAISTNWVTIMPTCQRWGRI